MPEGFPAAVLVRGISLNPSNLEIKKLRNYFKIQKLKIENFNLINGPGRVCKVLGIDKSFYGEDLTTSKHIWVENGIKVNKQDIIVGKRIGIGYAGESANWEWNYKIKL